MSRQPLAEVFGFPADNLSSEATRYRTNRLCPFNNRVPSCTKDKAHDPLGVCSIIADDHVAITCPVRFREGWLVAEDASRFFFPRGMTWTSLTEVRLNDRYGRSAGNVDVVLVAYDSQGRIVDFGTLEIQAVYISGNIRGPFEYYMQDPNSRSRMTWTRQYPRPDYLSSSRKRLAPQLLYKGGIINAWGKKQAVAIHRAFLETLPELPEVAPAEADVAWLTYELVLDKATNRYHLDPHKTIYTKFGDSLERITLAEGGPLEEFMDHLQFKLDEHLENNNPPEAPTLTDLLET